MNWLWGYLIFSGTVYLILLARPMELQRWLPEKEEGYVVEAAIVAFIWPVAFVFIFLPMVAGLPYIWLIRAIERMKEGG